MHNYEQKNVEYEIEIEVDGSIKGIISEACNAYIDYETGEGVDYPNGREKILEITQWGETGLERVDLSYCTNLRKIASPSENSFININPEYGFIGAFAYCEKLTEIPADLFSNCPQITRFEETFSNCVSLTSLPQTLFDNCLNVRSFAYTFVSCQNLEGEAIPLWERIENGEENDYSEGIPNGFSCYSSCTKLSNYESIPAYWRQRSE